MAAVSFHERTFANRFGAMGDEAESVFEATHPAGYVRFGLNRPPLHMASLPVRVRYAPDYLTSKGFVEVKGCGRDQRLKVKLENLNALHYWNQLFTTSVFVWDSSKKRHTTFTIKQLQKVIDDPAGGVVSDHFHDGKMYFAVPLEAFDGWVDHEA